MTHPPTRVAFVHDGALSAEQEAALEWLSETELPAEAVPFADLESAADRFDVLWWHRDRPIGAADPLTLQADTLDSFLEAGGGLLLTLRAMGSVDALGAETVPPDSVGVDTLTEPTGVLWRSLYDDHPIVDEFDSLRIPLCDRGDIPYARYESVLPSNGEVLASKIWGDRDIPKEMTVLTWAVGEGTIIGVGAPLAFDPSASDAVAENRTQFATSILTSLAADDAGPSRPKDAAGMRSMRSRLDARDETDRPQYHLTAPANWLNDPNGLIKWDGQYHVYYQYNPAGPFHNTIHWGHAVSDDLVTWRDEPVALSPSPDGPDRDGCWSGCAVDDDGTPTILYTGGNGRTQLPCLATAADPALRQWTKHDDNPIITELPAELDILETDHWDAEFRDHCVWREDGRWRQLIGTGLTDTGGAALAYTASNLEEWTYDQPLLLEESGSAGTVWECPELLELGDKQLLHVSNYEEVIYFIGEVQEGSFVVDSRGTLDYGDFYAPQSLRDGDRQLTFGWLQPRRDLSAQWDAGWSGALSLPRVLTLGPDNRLRQRPATEVTALRKEHLEEDRSRTITDGERHQLEAAGTAIELTLEVTLEDATAFELAVFESPTGEERTAIRYTHDGALLVDRSNSSADPRVTTDSQRMPVTPYDEPVSLRCFLDNTVIELYANERHCLTSRVYPTRADATGISLAAEGGRATVNSLSSWSLSGADGW